MVTPVRVPGDAELKAMAPAKRLHVVREFCAAAGAQLTLLNDAGALRVTAGDEDFSVAGVQFLANSDLRRLRSAAVLQLLRGRGIGDEITTGAAMDSESGVVLSPARIAQKTEVEGFR